MIVIYQKRRAMVFKGNESNEYDCYSFRVLDNFPEDLERFISWWLIPGTYGDL